MNGSFGSSYSRPGNSGKPAGTLFFIFFAGMGSLFTLFVARAAIAELRAWTWPKSDCVIVSSSVGETNSAGRRTGDFYFHVQFRYAIGGQNFASDQYKLKPGSFSDYSDAERLAERYQAGSSAVCFVNPSAPTQAVLDRGNPLFPLVILFPLLFVAIGVGGIYFTWRGKSANPDAVRPMSAGAGSAKWVAAGFFSIFLLMGGAFFYGVFIRPVSRIVGSRAWTEVPCVVHSSEVRTHSGRKGSTYSVNILYRYSVGGREFKANRYDFMAGSSSGYTGKLAIVRQHPPGSKSVCYVNPSDPTDAVLDRGFTAQVWFGLIPLVFVAVGCFGLIGTLRGGRNFMPGGATRRWSLAPAAAKAGAVPGMPAGGATGSIVLKPRTPPWGNFVATAVGMLFWNGIVSVFVTFAVQSWRSRHPQWFLTIFLIPFVVIGVGSVFMVVKAFLNLFNPRLRVTVTPGAARLGGTLRVEWEFPGHADRVQTLRVWLEGREEAANRQRRSNIVEKSVFARCDIMNTTTPQDIRSGRREVTIPAKAMHSFAGGNNKIVWSIWVRGQVSGLPGVNAEFPITVLPGAPAALP